MCEQTTWPRQEWLTYTCIIKGYGIIKRQFSIYFAIEECRGYFQKQMSTFSMFLWRNKNALIFTVTSSYNVSKVCLPTFLMSFTFTVKEFPLQLRLLIQNEKIRMVINLYVLYVGVCSISFFSFFFYTIIRKNTKKIARHLEVVQ